LNEKKEVGEKAVDFVKEGMVVGLGTGTTVLHTISKLGKLVQQGFYIKGIPTSKQTEKLAIEVGIPLVSFNEIDHIDLAIDGADEVNRELDLIKGGGGALLREKIIAKAAKNFIVVADSQKVVNKLGSFPLPVEVVPFGFEMTMKHIRELGGSPKLRQKNGVPFITDNGNYIIDCDFSGLQFTEYLEKNINMIPGVVDNGLFIGMADIVITLDRDKSITIYERDQDWIRTEKCF
jgi:ribose 5-phosphate isomerase A